jgi:hypothetical protein
MRRALPRWFGRTEDRSDTERLAAMTPDERLRQFVEVCDLTRAILAERADLAEVLERSEPMPAEAERTWLRLVAEARRDREAR